MAFPCVEADSPEIALMRKNDARYRVRRWNAYVAGRKSGDSEDFKAFAMAYDATSDAMNLDAEPDSPADTTATK